nr:hypothetical protein [Tanacetum cinerariifolium]
MGGNPQQEVVNFLARDSWQCKKQTIVATSTTEAEYVDAAHYKTEENAEFHQIVDFLSTCSINYALTVSPTIYASYIEQFWNTAISKTVNSIKQIHAIVDGKAVVISKLLVRSDLLFNDEDGIAYLTNAEIFENLALMGYEQIYTKLTFQKAHIEQILPSLSTFQRKYRKTHKPRKAKKVTELPQTSMPLDIRADEAVHQEEGDSVERAITTDASLVAAQDSDRPRHQETTLGGTNAQTRFKTASKRSSDPPLSTSHTVGSRENRIEQETDLPDFVPPTPHDSPLLLGHTPRSDEGRPNLLELMNIFTKLSTGFLPWRKQRLHKTRVLTLEEAKTTQDKVITRLKLRVRRLEKKKKRKARTSQPMKKRLLKGRVETSIDKILEDKGSGEKGGSTADEVSTIRPKVSPAAPSNPLITTTIFGDEYLTIAQTLIKMRRRISRVGQSTKERQKQEEATIAALIEEFDEIQARMDVDHELAVCMTHEEQETYTIEERARLLAEYFKRRKKHLAAEREEAIRNKPPTRTPMDRCFVPMDFEKEEKKSVEPESKDKKGKRIKRVTDLAPKQKSSKKQKMMQEQESAKKIVDPEILSTKYPIVDWESQILGNVDMEDKHVYKIIRANGNTSYHKSLSSMLRKFDRQDLVDLHKLVMKRFKDNTQKVIICCFGEILREKVSSHQGNAREDVELEARS